MLHLVFSIYDAKAAAFLPPFILPKAEMAKRTFMDCVASEDHQFGKHPEDYTLFELGHWNDENATYTLQRVPDPILSGLDCVSVLTSPEPENGEIQSSAPAKVGNGSSVLSGATGEDSS